MIIQRKKYLDMLISGEGNNLVKIVTGVRWCGKSFLLCKLFRNYLTEKSVDEQHIIELSWWPSQQKTPQSWNFAGIYWFTSSEWQKNDIHNSWRSSVGTGFCWGAFKSPAYAFCWCVCFWKQFKVSVKRCCYRIQRQRRRNPCISAFLFRVLFSSWRW